MTRMKIVLAVSLFATPALAQENFDAYVAPALGAGRVVGLGGAFTAVAEGADGLFRNPAALANRSKRSDWGFRLYLSLDLSLDNLNITPGEADLDADGEASAIEKLALGNTSLGIMVSKFAFGFVASGSEIVYEDAVRPFSLSLSRASFPVSFAAGDGEMIVGAGPVLQTLTLDPKGDGGPRKYRGVAFEAGALWRPPELPLRFGTRLTSESSGENDDGPGFAKAHFPWEAAVGVAFGWRFDGRSYNFLFSEDEVDDADQRYLLVSTEAVFVGVTPDGFGGESLVTQDVPKRSGENVGVSLRLGVESEAVNERLRVRGGSYSEADRIGGKTIGRVHGTGGFDLQLVDLIVWNVKLAASVDLAEGYQNVQFGIGSWD
jgi:hypothetical protein